ncbi:MAG: methyltransferase [Acidilobaceae archaeon]
MEIYDFRRTPSVTVDEKELLSLLEACRAGVGNVKVDLGLRSAKVEKVGSLCVISTEVAVVRVESKDLERVLEESRGREVFVLEESGTVSVAEIRGAHYYKLVSLGETAPTLEINGIHMHRVSGTTPWKDAELKARLVGARRGTKVLDVCTGLGYTAIHSLLLGSASVTTIEVDENVLSLAEVNPWSELLGSENVVLIHGDAVEVVKELEGSYHAIIHDPPRFTSSTSKLYSIEFYKEFYRLLKREGRLFHYTGEPKRARGARFPSKVASRLREAGFKIVRYDPRALGIIAIKL